MKSTTQRVLLKETFQAALLNSVGTKMFQRVYVKVGGKKKDVMQKGSLSCAFYVSSLLAMFGLMDRSHATVRTTEKNAYQTRLETSSHVSIWECVDLGRHSRFGWTPTYWILFGQSKSNQ